MVSGTHSHTSILHNKVHMASSATPATDAIFTSITTTLATERNAGAAWRAVAEKAHLAAVMGSSLARHTRTGGGWDVRAGIQSDPSLAAQVNTATRPDQLEAAIQSHIEWIAEEIRNGIIDGNGVFKYA